METKHVYALLGSLSVLYLTTIAYVFTGVAGRVEKNTSHIHDLEMSETRLITIMDSVSETLARLETLASPDTMSRLNIALGELEIRRIWMEKTEKRLGRVEFEVEMFGKKGPE